jgi:hypothetical protein
MSRSILTFTPPSVSNYLTTDTQEQGIFTDQIRNRHRMRVLVHTRRNKFSASGWLRDLNMSATNIPSECKIATIALNDAMILPYDANPGRMEFSGRATGKSCDRRWSAYGTSREYNEAPLSTRGASRMREIRTYGSMQGARGNSRPYRNPYWPRSATRSSKISHSTLDSPGMMVGYGDPLSVFAVGPTRF